MRKIDTTEHICKLCGSTQTIGGIRTHLQTKHHGYNTERYVAEFGEFRRKKLDQIKKAESSEIICHECNEKMISHKNLMHHIRIHGMSYEEYFVKNKFHVGSKLITSIGLIISISILAFFNFCLL